MEKRTLYLIASIVFISIFIAGCQSTSNKDTKEQETTDNEEETLEQPQANHQTTDAKPIVTMTMEDGGVVKAELYPNIAPNTVNNFISLIEAGLYDGLMFHRVIPGFMIQGGDAEGTGMGGPGYAIKGEFRSNGFENNLKHDAGVLSMARSQHPDSAGSQ